MLLVDRAHECRCWRQDLVDEDEDGLLRRKLDTLPNNVDELAHGQILSYLISTEPRLYQFPVRTDGTKYFFLSIVGISVLSAFSQITCNHATGVKIISSI